MRDFQVDLAPFLRVPIFPSTGPCSSSTGHHVVLVGHDRPVAEKVEHRLGGAFPRAFLSTANGCSGRSVGSPQVLLVDPAWPDPGREPRRRSTSCLLDDRQWRQSCTLCSLKNFTLLFRRSRRGKQVDLPPLLHVLAADLGSNLGVHAVEALADHLEQIARMSSTTSRVLAEYAAWRVREDLVGGRVRPVFVDAQLAFHDGPEDSGSHSVARKTFSRSCSE